MKHRIQTALCLTLSSFVASTAQAEISLSGTLGFEYDQYDDDFNRYINGEVRLGYSTGLLTFGVGLMGEAYLSGEFNEGGQFVFVEYGNFTVSHGDIWGAGNIFPEDSFAMSDTTSARDGTTRIDAKFGNHDLAISVESGGGNDGDLELGYRGLFDGFMGEPLAIVVGYEDDQQDLGFAVAQTYGDWVGIGALSFDLDDPIDITGSQVSLTVVRHFNENISLAAHYAIDRDGEPHSYGALANFTVGDLIGKIEWFEDEVGDTNLEIGVMYRFGDHGDSRYARLPHKEYRPAFGFFD